MQKMKILVPIDFSKTSFSAYLYAIQLAKDLDAVITLYYVQLGSFSTADNTMDFTLIEDEAEINAQLEYFAQEHPIKEGIDLPKIYTQYYNEIGVPRYAIVNKATSENYDLIVIGTREKTSIFDRLLGTTSRYVVTHADCPVIAIHKGTRYTPIDSIVFAVDNKGGVRSNIQKFDAFNRRVKAYTEFIYVDTQENKQLTKALNEVTNELLEDHDPPYSFEIKSIKGDDVQDAIIDYCIYTKADLLVLIHRHEGIVDTIINGSIARRITESFHLPILILNNK